jgi:hypothetical protein
MSINNNQRRTFFLFLDCTHLHNTEVKKESTGKPHHACESKKENERKLRERENVVKCEWD